MFLLVATFLFLSAGSVGSMPNGPGVPENITVTFINPTSVRVSWTTSIETVDKYDVTYKPTDASYRVVAVVAGNSDAVTLSNLKADTQYQLTVATVWGGKKYKSRLIVFRTLEAARTSPMQEPMSTLSSERPPQRKGTDAANLPEYTPNSSTVRGVEIAIVLLVLFVWIGAIALFFNRWGKIRMLLPYQPDYKQEQLKVPGTAACAAAVASGNTCNHHLDQTCQQACIHHSRTQRPRINSAIFTSYSGPGFDSKEFMRRHGSVSKLCRKAKSVDNISLPDKHFGLPTLSISGPSPPEDEEIEMGETECFLSNDERITD